MIVLDLVVIGVRLPPGTLSFQIEMKTALVFQLFPILMAFIFSEGVHDFETFAMERVIFVVDDRIAAPDEDQAFPLVHPPDLIRSHELPAQNVIVVTAGPVLPERLPFGLLVDGELAQHLRHVLVRLSFISAKVDHGIGVADDRLPFILEQGLQLGLVLQDDVAGDIAASHRRNDLREVIRQCDIRELIHPERGMDGETSAVFEVRDIVQLLENLAVQHTYQKVVGLVVVRDDAEQGGLAVRVLIDSFPDRPDVHVVVIQDVEDLRVLQEGKPRVRGNDDGPYRVRGAGDDLLVGDLGRMVIREDLHQAVQAGLLRLVIGDLGQVQEVQHLPDRGLLSLLGRLIPDVGHDCLKIQGQRVVPEGIPAVLTLRLRVGHDIRHQLDDVVVRPDIVEGIVAVRLVRIDQVEGDHPVSVEFQDPA